MYTNMQTTSLTEIDPNNVNHLELLPRCSITLSCRIEPTTEYNSMQFLSRMTFLTTPSYSILICQHRHVDLSSILWETQYWGLLKERPTLTLGVQGLLPPRGETQALMINHQHTHPPTLWEPVSNTFNGMTQLHPMLGHGCHRICIWCLQDIRSVFWSIHSCFYYSDWQLLLKEKTHLSMINISNAATVFKNAKKGNILNDIFFFNFK